MTKDYFIEYAFKLAEENVLSGNGGPFGAIIVKDGKIIGKGTNTVTSNNDPTAHAEINAIRDACKNIETFHLNDCEIYSTSEPCPMCLAAIYWAKIKCINYALSQAEAHNAGFDDSFIYSEFNLPSEKRQIPAKKFKVQSTKFRIFELWSSTKNKILY